MIRIICDYNWINEKKYICEIIFSEFLGLEYCFEENRICKNSFILEINNKMIFLPNILFKTKNTKWLTADSLPKLPLEKINPSKVFEDYKGEDNLPVIYGGISMLEDIKVDNDIITIDVDIFGSCFFMLTRYEEYVIKKRDSHDRFDYKNSISYNAGFLNRPIVNEYVELLWCAIKRVAPYLQRKIKKFQVIPTHDIDKPFGMMYDSKKQIIRHFIGDLIFRKDINCCFKRIKELFDLFFYKNKYLLNKIKTYEYLFEISRKYNLVDYYFFMNSKSSYLDGNYLVDDNNILELIKNIISEGHFVGLHPSYISYKNLYQIQKEARSFNEILIKYHLPKIIGARQHYLRWSNPETWQIYESVNIPFDSSLTYAGYVGFRCGTCYEYSVYDLINRKMLNLKEMPLIVMDGTLFEYMQLDNENALNLVINLAEKCRKYEGNFVFLWHNTTLDNVDERIFYSAMLEKICR